jgi:hypothetical protein
MTSERTATGTRKSMGTRADGHGLQRERVAWIAGYADHQPTARIVAHRAEAIAPRGDGRQREERRGFPSGATLRQHAGQFDPQPPGRPRAGAATTD